MRFPGFYSSQKLFGSGERVGNVLWTQSVTTVIAALFTHFNLWMLEADAASVICTPLGSSRRTFTE